MGFSYIKIDERTRRLRGLALFSRWAGGPPHCAGTEGRPCGPSAKRPASRPLRGAAILFLMTLALGGCSATKVTQPLPAELYGNDVDTQLEFWHTLAERPLASNND